MAHSSTISTDKVIVHSDCSLVPPMAKGNPFFRQNGVFDVHGSFIQHANIRRDGGFELSGVPRFGRPEALITGTHLYGGQLNHHFGHFLCETLSRLWPLARNAEGAESVVLMPRRPQGSTELQGFQKLIFGYLDLPIPVQIITAPTRIERLVIPEQGFGTADLAAGIPEFRAYIREKFAQHVPADGPEKLYISREGLRLTKGGLFGEETLSTNLVPQGYTEFRPEAHDLETQIARYKAAKHVIAVEGSALHLLGFVGSAEQNIGIIARRSNLIAANALGVQIRAFTGAKTTVIDAIEREWDESVGAHLSSKSMAELDYSHVRSELCRVGLVSDATWDFPPPNIESRLKRIADRTGRLLQIRVRQS